MSTFHDLVNQLPHDSPDVFRRLLTELGGIDDKLRRGLPWLGDGFVDMPLTTAPTNPVTPPASTFTVLGLDGKFQITVTLPQNTQAPSVAMRRQLIVQDQNSLLAPMVHQLQSATSVKFDATSATTTYDLGAALAKEIQDPNQTKFWRLRSSFDGQAWNPWQIFISAAVCGPVAVQSGFERSTSVAPRSVLNTNNATADSVDAGANATIRVYGSGGVGSSYTRFDGQGNQITTAGASILGAAYSTQYAIVLNQLLVHLAFPTVTQYLQTIADAFFYIATVGTVAAGGAGGLPGGGGTGGGGTPGTGPRKLPQL
ncbi:MAG TPA: hypothetical protein VGP89_18050 [Candidatus Angelobacter sp.]|nr:hypothetical protein [Candidatus Angelobacter sp.]